MADLRSMPTLLSRDAARERLIDEAIAEEAAKEEELEREMRQYMERMSLQAKKRRLERNLDAGDDEDDDEDDEDDGVDEEVREEWERKKLQVIEEDALHRKAARRILDYDPKQGGLYYTRIYCVNLHSFDLDEESPLPPMRYTDVVYKSPKDYELCEGVNILSVKIGSLDVDFPIHVYGTVVARDSLDKKCVYLFCRDRQHSQTINSKDESLILTGPKRGLALISSTFVEINLIIKGDERQEDRELSKGVLEIPGTEQRALKGCELESLSLATRLSTVDLMYGVVRDAVEATISIEVLAGEFSGEITACTSSIKNTLVLHDSRLLAHVAGGEKFGPVIPLLRSVVAVHVKEKMLLTFAAFTEDGEIASHIKCVPKINGSSQYEATVGSAVLRVNVVWSIIDF
ncbi:hypothetical protein BS78_09G009300 [Paspalum vaginatum]|nr:hypothetical protein BS78_09G009300 [Paspalum vaginatum]